MERTNRERGEGRRCESLAQGLLLARGEILNDVTRICGSTQLDRAILPAAGHDLAVGRERHVADSVDVKRLAEDESIASQVPQRDLSAGLAPGQPRLVGRECDARTQPRGRSGGVSSLTNRPVRTSKRLTLGTGALASPAAMSRPSGENAMPVMKELRMRRWSVPICCKARDG